MMANFKRALSTVDKCELEAMKGGNALCWPFDELDEVFEYAERPDAEQCFNDNTWFKDCSFSNMSFQLSIFKVHISN